MRGVGAYVMGRRMFGGGRGEAGAWDESWTGWWGDDPPFHAPVFVLTHHPRDPIPMAGGTTFTFVGGLRFEPLTTVATANATHVKYRVLR